MALLKATGRAAIKNVTDAVVSATAPKNPFKGMSWTDTSREPPVTKVWDGKTWVDKLGEMEGTVTQHTQTLESHEVKISANENAINLRVTQQTYNENKLLVDDKLLKMDSSLNDVVSDISVLQGEIALKVGQTEIDTAVKTVKNDFGTTLKSYSTIKQMESAITASKGSILSEVSSTYSTKTELDAASGKITSLETWKNEAAQKITDKAIIATVSSTYATKAENEAVDKVANSANTVATQTAAKFDWLVKSGTSASNFTLTDRMASLVAAEINLTGYITATNLKEDGATTISGGKLTCTNADISGKVTATSGKIGGFNVNSAIYSGTNKLGATNSVYLGTDGISCGVCFKATSAGLIEAQDLKVYGNIFLYESSKLAGGASPGTPVNICYYSAPTIGASQLVIGSGIAASNSSWPAVSGGGVITLSRNTLINGVLKVGEIRIGDYIVRAVGGDGRIGVADSMNSPIAQFSYEGHVHAELHRTYSGKTYICGAYAGSGWQEFRSNADNALKLGTENFRWKRLFAGTSSSITSDENEKNILGGIDSKYENIFMELNPILYTFKNFSESDNHDRIHCGLGAQSVEKTALKYGLTSKEFAVICKDSLDTPTVDGRKERYGLAYGELHGLEIHMIQKNRKEILEMLKRIKTQENEIRNLKSQLLGEKIA